MIAQPAAAPPAMATIPAAPPRIAERSAKLVRMVARVAPSVLRTDASKTRPRSPAAAAPISTTNPVSSVAPAPQEVAAASAESASVTSPMASRTRIAVMLGASPATSRRMRASASSCA